MQNYKTDSREVEATQSDYNEEVTRIADAVARHDGRYDEEMQIEQLVDSSHFRYTTELARMVVDEFSDSDETAWADLRAKPGTDQWYGLAAQEQMVDDVRTELARCRVMDLEQ